LKEPSDSGRWKVKVKELTVEQLKTLIEDTVEERLQEYLGDPDEGLEIREEIIQKLKSHEASRKPRIPMEQVAKKYGIELK
jgi:predicted house-cleaning noncanonical NTP pyrophosphatase (MazG superfamily)